MKLPTKIDLFFDTLHTSLLQEVQSAIDVVSKEKSVPDKGRNCVTKDERVRRKKHGED